MSLRGAQRRGNLNPQGGRLLRFAHNDIAEHRASLRGTKRKEASGRRRRSIRGERGRIGRWNEGGDRCRTYRLILIGLPQVRVQHRDKRGNHYQLEHLHPKIIADCYPDCKPAGTRTILWPHKIRCQALGWESEHLDAVLGYLARAGCPFPPNKSPNVPPFFNSDPHEGYGEEIASSLRSSQ